MNQNLQQNVEFQKSRVPILIAAHLGAPIAIPAIIGLSISAMPLSLADVVAVFYAVAIMCLFGGPYVFLAIAVISPICFLLSRLQARWFSFLIAVAMGGGVGKWILAAKLDITATDTFTFKFVVACVVTAALFTCGFEEMWRYFVPPANRHLHSNDSRK